MSRPDTKILILDAAEYLFARHGYNGTSLRDITGRAQVNLAAVNYHFGAKQELVKAVIERRLLPLNALRDKKMRQVEYAMNEEASAVETREILNAFIEPTVHFRNSCAGAEDFIVLVGRILAEPDQTAREIFMDLIRPLFCRLARMLSRKLPHLPEDVLFCRLVFILGAMGHGLNALEKCGQLAPELTIDRTPHTVVNNLLSFVVGGIEAPI